ncbi:MAG: hypothetical protein KJO99_05180 [Nitrosopumilus sp.]|nr:hypothetical protein [Nitrosopumilus sp.]NNL53385.1 hypothetical protein [Nitrosopumilus sp.]
MDPDEKIVAHILSVWREAKKFWHIGGREGMLILTNKHLMFVIKTEAKMKWWQAMTERQFINFAKSKNTMITYDGYDEKNLLVDMENKQNLELAFDNILKIEHEELVWGSVINLEYAEDGKKKKYRFSVVRDWVKYPAKEPTKYLKVDWKPFVQYIKDKQRVKE